MTGDLANLLRSLLNSGQPWNNETESVVRRMLPQLESTLGWKPFPGPQTQAYASPADELFFGGSAGCGKSWLLIGLALTAHKKTLLLRRESVQLTAIVESLKKTVGVMGSWRSSGPNGGTMRIGNRVIELAGCEQESDQQKFQGRDHDAKFFDEISHFTRSQYKFIIGWNRTDDPRQRCRVVCAGNPPTTPEGRWVVEEWGPWLDQNHHDPASPGELRWYTYLDGQIAWFKTGNPFTHKGETIRPRSRTFIPARLQDNPVYMATNYLATLQAMPEPLRSQMLYGDFSAGMEDDAWQVIPSAWVRLAQARWTETPPTDQPLSCLGLDVAWGGADRTVVAPRYGTWFARPKKYQGEVTDSGAKAGYLALKEHDGNAPIHVDVIGYGASCYESLRDKLGDKVIPVNVAEATTWHDRSGEHRLTNKRAAMYWKLREALDPVHGDNLALPPDPELLADLTAPHFEVRSSGIVVEPKENLKKRIGRSPDVGDAVALAHLQTRIPWEVSTVVPVPKPEGRHFGQQKPTGSRMFGRGR